MTTTKNGTTSTMPRDEKSEPLDIESARHEGESHAAENEGAPSAPPGSSDITRPSPEPPPGYKFHRAAGLLPLMSVEEFAEFRKDLRAHGLREPIKRLGDEIIDGRTRLWGCVVEGIEPRFEELTEAEVGSPTEYVLSLGLHRRHLTAGQKALLANKVVERLLAEAKQKAESEATERKEAVGGEPATAPRAAQQSPSRDDASDAAKRKEAARTTSRAAKITGAGATATKKVRRLQNVAPEVVAQLEAGTLTVAEAERLAGIAKTKTATVASILTLVATLSPEDFQSMVAELRPRIDAVLALPAANDATHKAPTVQEQTEFARRMRFAVGYAKGRVAGDDLRMVAELKRRLAAGERDRCGNVIAEALVCGLNARPYASKKSFIDELMAADRKSASA
jgi:hypothetical protein